MPTVTRVMKIGAQTTSPFMIIYWISMLGISAIKGTERDTHIRDDMIDVPMTKRFTYLSNTTRYTNIQNASTSSPMVHLSNLFAQPVVFVFIFLSPSPFFFCERWSISIAYLFPFGSCIGYWHACCVNACPWSCWNIQDISRTRDTA